MDETRLNYTEIDFGQNKDDLINFLKSQDEFSDYNFDGSALSILVNLLAASNHYQSVYTNMVANEAFLDSATVRESVVSHAKKLGYTPSSKTAASLRLSLLVDDADVFGTPATITLPRGSVFTATVPGSSSYDFVATEDIIIQKDNNDDYPSDDVDVKEGVFKQYAYQFDSANPNQRFYIPNLNADISELTVRIRNSRGDSTTTTWSLATDTMQVGSTSNVYWVQEGPGGFFEVVFGDGVIGKKPTDGNVVILEYLVTNGSDANGAGRTHTTASPTITLTDGEFEYSGGSTSTVEITLVTEASGGAEKESVDSIKFLAPKIYSTQNRAVTANDYRALLLSQFPYIQSATVWGGEDESPQQLGKVFAAVRVRNSDFVNDTIKSEIASFLDSKNVITIAVEVVDADITYIVVESQVRFDQTVTTQTPNGISSLVTSTISSFNDTNLDKFDRDFLFSRLSEDIDNTEGSIISNDSIIKMKKKVSPTLGVDTTYTLDFNTPIFQSKDTGNPSVVSGSFTASISGEQETGSFKDDGNGLIVWTDDADGMQTYIGTVNYSSGIITLTDFNVTDVTGTDFDVICVPGSSKNAAFQGSDVFADRRQLLTIDPVDINVTAVDDQLVV